MDTSTQPTSNDSNINENNLMNEIQRILNFVYRRGIRIPDTISMQSINNDKQNINITNLVSDYNNLVSSILPATPESIKYVGKEFEGNIESVKAWNIPVVKKYLGLSLLALFGLIGFSLMPNVTSINQEKGILGLYGLSLLENLGVIFFASLLGVMFFVLKTIKDKIDNFTLVEVDIFSFNISIMIGVVSGFIISELFTFSSTIMGSSIEVHKMTLALLGGFASDSIFTILQNIVNKIKTLFAS